MLTFPQRPQPGTRRVLEAMQSTASKERPGGCAVDLPAWKASLIRGHRKVRELYREVLATHDMPQAERTSIQDRIARIEAELASLEPKLESGSSYQHAA